MMSGPIPQILCALLAPLAGLGASDSVPAALDQALAAPEDPILFNFPEPPAAARVFELVGVPVARTAIAVSDVTGDGRAELAVGFAAGPIARTLQVFDGDTGEVLWRAAAGDFRWLRALAADSGRVYAATGGTEAAVHAFDAASGAPLWSRVLAARPGTFAYALEPVPDLGGAPGPDVLVGAGAGVDAVLALDGGDGEVLWSWPAGGPVYDVRTLADLDGDGVDDVLACGGQDAPFAAALSGIDGTTLWSAPLDGPGAALLVIGDVTDDGRADVAVGQFAGAAGGVVALDGADGARLWTATSIPHDVTSLARVGDFTGDGVAELATGSFDNAINTLEPVSGAFLWRRETSPNNGGAVFSIAAVGDLNGNGLEDLLATSVDHQLYVLDGDLGNYLTSYNLRRRGVAVARLPADTGPARFAVAGQERVAVIEGDSGLAGGPVVEIVEPVALSGIVRVVTSSFPGEPLLTFAALAPGSAPLGIGEVELGLDAASTVLLKAGLVGGTAESTVFLGPFTRDVIGVEVFVQSATIYAPASVALSAVTSFVVGP